MSVLQILRYSVIAGAAIGTAVAAGPDASFKRVFAINAESGIVAIEGTVISMFSPGDISIESSQRGDWELVSTQGGSVSVRIKGGVAKFVRPGIPLSRAHEFSLCDQLNQIDLKAADPTLTAALKAVRLKQVINLTETLLLAVYSNSGDGAPYDIRIALVREPRPLVYSVIATDTVTEDAGAFCGVQLGRNGVFVVQSDEPSASNDFRAAYVYQWTSAK